MYLEAPPKDSPTFIQPLYFFSSKMSSRAQTHATKIEMVDTFF
ncbi:hypothetical protein D881_03835 [Corynebacterium ulcerans NCTC 12077]|nr:hypothetical protein D881_03835 [Corynebacterium ulcerans NCTC 12077]